MFDNRDYLLPRSKIRLRVQQHQQGLRNFFNGRMFSGRGDHNPNFILYFESHIDKKSHGKLEDFKSRFRSRTY